MSIKRSLHARASPELHFLGGKWHIYFAASDGKNENHLAYVLVSEDSDPLGNYTLHGPLETGDQAGESIWAMFRALA